MTTKTLAGLLALGCVTLAACDQKETRASADAGPSSLAAPEPARFGARTEPAWAAGEEPKSAAAASLKAAAAASSGAVDPAAGDLAGRKIFDGVNVSSLGLPAVPQVQPAARARAGAPTRANGVVLSNRQMAIDSDGIIKDPAAARRVLARDPWHRNGTALTYADGRPLDATVVPYISLPLDYRGASLGDLALVEFNGRKVWAVCGDRGPKGKFGEASTAVAEALGINSDGISGGVKKGVTYTLFPGSSKGKPRSEADLLAFIADGAGTPQGRMQLAAR